MADRKSRSGPNIPDVQRNTIRVTLRLDPGDHEALVALAERWGVTLAEAVGKAVETAVEAK